MSFKKKAKGKAHPSYPELAIGSMDTQGTRTRKVCKARKACKARGYIRHKST